VCSFRLLCLGGIQLEVICHADTADDQDSSFFLDFPFCL